MGVDALVSVYNSGILGRGKTEFMKKVDGPGPAIFSFPILSFDLEHPISKGPSFAGLHDPLSISLTSPFDA